MGFADGSTLIEATPQPEPWETVGLRLPPANRQYRLVDVIARGGAVLARSGNRTLELKDPTAHAEMLAIREACRATDSERLPDADLYVTLEPCAMCAAALSFARIRRLYFGAADEKGGAVVSGTRFYASPTCHHRPEVIGGVGASKSAELLREFFKGLR